MAVPLAACGQDHLPPPIPPRPMPCPSSPAQELFETILLARMLQSEVSTELHHEASAKCTKTRPNTSAKWTTGSSSSTPYSSKYLLRRYLDPLNPPQSHRRYDWSSIGTGCLKAIASRVAPSAMPEAWHSVLEAKLGPMNDTSPMGLCRSPG